MSTTIITHPAPAVERAALELANEYRAAGNERAAQRIERAAADIRSGATLAVVPGGYEASSGSERGMVYTIDAITGACSCPARAECKHQARIELLERAACYTAPTITQVRAVELAQRQARRDAAIADMLELYPEKLPEPAPAPVRRPLPVAARRAAA